MAVTDKKIHKDAKVALRHVVINLPNVVASQTNLTFARIRPGYEFEVVGVQTYSELSTGITDMRVQIDDGVTPKDVLAANVAVTDVTRVEGELNATLDNRRGLGDHDLLVQYTSGASIAARNISITVTLRPRPLNQEA